MNLIEYDNRENKRDDGIDAQFPCCGHTPPSLPHQSLQQRHWPRGSACACRDSVYQHDIDCAEVSGVCMWVWLWVWVWVWVCDYVFNYIILCLCVIFILEFFNLKEIFMLPRTLISKRFKTHKFDKYIVEIIRDTMEQRQSAYAMCTFSHPLAPVSIATALAPRERVRLPRLCIPTRH